MEEQPQSDHDNIVTLISEVRQVRVDIKDLKDGTAVTIADHETRLRSLEKWAWLAIGALYIINFLIGIYIASHYHS